MKRKLVTLALAAASTIGVLPVFAASAEEITVQMNIVTDAGITEPLGQIVITDIAHGIEITPTLSGLTPGQHGFHVHENGSCEPALDDEGMVAAAQSAGGHYDPEGTNKHGSPLTNDGHKGDMPVINVGADGRATMSIQAAHLTMEDIRGRALIIHAGGDNFTDTPPNGGAGARFACGVVPGADEPSPALQSTQ